MRFHEFAALPGGLFPLTTTKTLIPLVSLSPPTYVAPPPPPAPIQIIAQPLPQIAVQPLPPPPQPVVQQIVAQPVPAYVTAQPLPMPLPISASNALFTPDQKQWLRDNLTGSQFNALEKLESVFYAYQHGAITPAALYAAIAATLPTLTVDQRNFFRGWLGLPGEPITSGTGNAAADQILAGGGIDITASNTKPGVGTVVIDAHTGMSTVVPSDQAPPGDQIYLGPPPSAGIPKWVWVLGGALVLNGLIKRG